jgi:hypothetical protein
LNDRTAHDAEIVPGVKSQFDVIADGQLIFSKQEQRRYPNADEIIRALG